MNYEQARQIGPNGPAPGKWNWTNRNDSIRPAPFTAWPCAWPDSPIPADWEPRQPFPERTGRERCDHDTAEEAERHHWQAELDRVRIESIDLETARERLRCDVDGCPGWETHRARWQGGYVMDSLCDEHATIDAVAALHPFLAGTREIHS